MGTIGDAKQRLNLVVMTNKDVYYVSTETIEDILSKSKSVTLNKFYEFRDIKSGATVNIETANISSLVRQESRDA